MKNLLSIYNTFKTKTIEKEREKESLNDIIKGTKSVLANKLKFKEYIQNYSKTTERYTFKSPGITEYPIFKKKSCLLIPVKRRRINFFEDLYSKGEKPNEESPIKKNNLFFITPKESFFKIKLKNNINTLENRKKIIKAKFYKLGLNRNINKKERYNSLFLDFFHKWNNNEYNSKIRFSPRDYIDCEKNKSYSNNNIKEIKNEKYSKLKYDDNKIFNEDYTNFINEKIEYIKKNKIENKQEKIESIFDDANGKEIKLKLESVKIHFKPINNNKLKTHNNLNEIKKNKDIILYIPLYYAFFICHKKFELFRQILISTIFFSNDFETITFNDQFISSSLIEFSNNNVINTPKISNTNEFKYDSKKNIRSPTNQLASKKTISFRKLATKNYGNLATTFASFGEKKPNNQINFTMLRNIYLEKNLKNEKKEEIIHSNRNRNTLYNINYLNENNNNYGNDNDNQLKNKNTINNNNNNFNEYIFLWETYKKTFLVTVQMPTIYFKYKSLKKEIIAFCDKNLFLYIYKHNFINWDFYVLNFLFSIKAFRKIILNNYSINRKNTFNDIFSKTISNERSHHPLNHILSNKNESKNKVINKQAFNSKLIINLNENLRPEISNNSIIINKNKNKIYNILNERNESYLFFYTDSLYNNSIFKLYSYLIVIDYEKLNPKLKWKYYLDFKQMKQLNEISKYESLDSFLPKIIKTDFQNGFLSMDFSLFNEFDIDILGYEKKNIMNENKNNKSICSNNLNNNMPNCKELCIDIQYPFVKVIKAINNNNNISLSTNNVELDINFLQKINNYKIDSWSQKILEVIKIGDDNLTRDKYFSPESSAKLIKNKNSFKITSLSNSANAKMQNKKFIKSITFNGIPVTSKFH